MSGGALLLRALGAVLWLVAAMAVITAPPAAAQSASQKAIDELMNIFGELCLKRFPDEAAIRAYAAGKGITPMSEARLRELLRTDPGEGWVQKTAGGEYLLTIELPPFHTCAVRKDLAFTPDLRTEFTARLTAWVATRAGAKMSAQPDRTPTISGRVSQALIFAIAVPGVEPAENLIAIITPFDDRQVEVRLARAIGNN